MKHALLLLLLLPACSTENEEQWWSNQCYAKPFHETPENLDELRSRASMSAANRNAMMRANNRR